MGLTRKEEKFLRNLIKESLLREYTDDYGVSYWTNSPSKGTYGSSLKSMFIDPFLDAFKVGTAELKKLGTRISTAIHTIIEAALSVAIPSYQADYEALMKQQQTRINDISKKYKGVYEAISGSFRHPDIGLYTFMLDPLAWLSLKAISRRPEETLDAFGVFGQTNKAIALFLKDIRNDLRGFGGADARLANMSNSGGDFGDSTTSESLLREKENPKETKAQFIQRRLSDPKFLEMIKDSDLAKEMKLDATKILSTTLEELQKAYKDSMAVNSIADIQKISKNPNVSKAFNSIDPSKKKEAETTVVQAFKDATKQFQKQNIEKQIDYLENQGVSPKNEYLLSLRRLISSM